MKLYWFLDIEITITYFIYYYYFKIFSIIHYFCMDTFSSFLLNRLAIFSRISGIKKDKQHFLN